MTALNPQFTVDLAKLTRRAATLSAIQDAQEREQEARDCADRLRAVVASGGLPTDDLIREYETEAAHFERFAIDIATYIRTLRSTL